MTIMSGMGKKRPRAGEKPATADSGDSTTEADSQSNSMTSLSNNKDGFDSTTFNLDDKEEEEEEGEESEPTDGLEDVMKENLELMLDIIMRIRDDPFFAKSIYADCPRLQHLLDQRPDLRPIFEDPQLVRITFEKAYISSGGVLPEDNKKSILAAIVNHPAFKFLRFIILLKKIMGLFQGGGYNMIKKWLQDLFRPDNVHNVVHNFAENADGVPEGGPDSGEDGADADADDGNPDNKDSKDSLNDAADKFQEPEMQEKIERLKEIDDPEQLAEEIENDPELRAIRDSNELCCELMSDPDTCRIMLDPDNLRALGECPDLIEADINNPDWTSGNIEVEGPDTDANMDMDASGPDDFDDDYGVGADAAHGADFADDGFDGGGDLESDGEFADEANDEEEEEWGLEFAMGEEEMDHTNQPGGNNTSTARSAGSKKPQPNPKSRAAQRKANQNNFIHNIGVGLTDMVAGEIVGFTAAELTGGGDGLEDLIAMDGMDEYGGMMDELDADDLEEVADAAEDTGDAVRNSNLLLCAADAVETFGGGDIADNIDQLEEGLDTVEETHDEKQAELEAGETSAAGVAIAAGPGEVGDDENQQSRSIESGEAEEEEKPKKENKFKVFGGIIGALAVAAKEHVATTLLGDDMGALVLEKMEEEVEEEEEEKEKEELKCGTGDHDIESGSSAVEHQGGCFANALDV